MNLKISRRFTLLCLVLLSICFPMSVKAHETIPVDCQTEDAFYIEDCELDKDLQQYAYETAQIYDVDVFLILAIIEKESACKEDAQNGDCQGLMQVSTKWHKERMERLNCDDLFDGKQNILVGTDYISELLDTYEDPIMALMAYNMKLSTAKKLYKERKYSNYATSIVKRSSDLRKAFAEKQKLFYIFSFSFFYFLSY